MKRTGWIQAVVATPVIFAHDSKSSSASAGVFQPSVFLGRPLRAAATADSSSALWMLRSVPFGKYCRSKPLVPGQPRRVNCHSADRVVLDLLDGG